MLQQSHWEGLNGQNHQFTLSWPAVMLSFFKVVFSDMYWFLCCASILSKCLRFYWALYRNASISLPFWSLSGLSTATLGDIYIKGQQCANVKLEILPCFEASFRHYVGCFYNSDMLCSGKSVHVYLSAYALCEPAPRQVIGSWLKRIITGLSKINLRSLKQWWVVFF